MAALGTESPQTLLASNGDGAAMKVPIRRFGLAQTLAPFSGAVQYGCVVAEYMRTGPETAKELSELAALQQQMRQIAAQVEQMAAQVRQAAERIEQIWQHIQ
jgi:hypothetical protein